MNCRFCIRIQNWKGTKGVIRACDGHGAGTASPDSKTHLITIKTANVTLTREIRARNETESGADLTPEGTKRANLCGDLFFFLIKEINSCENRHFPRIAAARDDVRAGRARGRINWLTLKDPHQHQHDSQPRPRPHGATSTGCSSGAQLLQSWARTPRAHQPPLNCLQVAINSRRGGSVRRWSPPSSSSSSPHPACKLRLTWHGALLPPPFPPLTARSLSAKINNRRLRGKKGGEFGEKNRSAPLSAFLSPCCVHLCRSGCTWSASRSVLCSSLSTEHRQKGAYFTCASCSVPPPGNWISTAPRRRTKKKTKTHSLGWLFSLLSGWRSSFWVFNWQSATAAAGVKHVGGRTLKEGLVSFLRTVVSKCRYFLTLVSSDLFHGYEVEKWKRKHF